jgi:cell division initiation protein
MIDLTPLDVRNKRGDFKKQMRGYNPHEVDVFLEMAAERLTELVRENIVLRERSETLERQVGAQTGREQAIQEALVTAQELRVDIQSQAQREADHVVRESETEAHRLAAEAEANVRNLLRDAERRLALGRDTLEEMERRRTRFLKAFRQLLEREIDVVDIEDQRAPLEERPMNLDLGDGRFAKENPEENSEKPRENAEQALFLPLNSDDSRGSDDSDSDSHHSDDDRA